MDFRKEMFSYLIFAVLLSSSVAKNLRPNYKPDPIEIECNDTESKELLKTLRNVQQFKKPAEKLLIVLTDSENNIYAPLKNKLLQKNAVFLPLHKTFKNDITDIYKNALFLDSASYVKFIIHADNAEKVANIFQQFVSIFKDVTGIYNCVGIALTLNNVVKKEQVVRKMYNAAAESNSSNVLDFVDRFLIPNGPPIAIFNNQSSNNPDVNTFLQDIYFTSRNENRDNFKFTLPEALQTMINCATTYVEKQVIIDVNHFIERKLKIYFDTLKEPVQESLSGIERAEAIANLTKSYNYLLRFSKQMSSVQNPRNFLENLKDTFRYTVFEDEFEKTYFLPQNVGAIQFLYLISNYTFASALDEWTKPLKDFKIQNPDSLEQWYQKEVGGYFLSRNFETKCVAILKGWKHQVRGIIIRLNEIDVHQCGSNTKLLEIFAVEKVFINVDLKLIGWEMQVVIIAPVWEVIGWPTIDLSGADAKELSESQAKNGSRTGNKHGSDGIAGLPGGSSGNFYGVANEIIDGKQLTILATGGKGGKGQDGGYGANGEDGETFQNKEKFNCKEGVAVGWQSKLYHTYYSHEGGLGSMFYYYLVYGKEGRRGGRGGNGGAKGLAGYGGNIILFDLGNSDGDYSPRTATFDGNSGANGRGGFSGYGGKNGYEIKMVCKITWIVDILFEGPTIYSKDTGRGSLGQDGTDGISLTLRKTPKTVPIVQNFPHTMNEYKMYVRPKLAKNDSESHVSSFYELLNTRKEITSLYNTLTLVEEFTGLELQGFDLDHQHLKPSFAALKERIHNYHNKPNYEKENTAEYQDVIKKLFHHITEKLETISKKKGYSVMTNIVKGFDYNGLEQIKKLEKQEDVNSKLETLNDKINPLDGLIEEAQSLIDNDLQNAMRDLQSTLDQKIDSLLEEISELKKNAKGREKELNTSRKQLQKMILLKGLFGLMKVGCALAGLVNPALGLVGVVASSTLSVIESQVTQNNITIQVAEVPKAVKALTTATETFLKNDEPNEDAFLEIHISEMMRNATSAGKTMIGRMRNNIKNLFKKPDSEPVLLSYKSLDRNEIYKKEEDKITNIMEQATKDKDADKVNDCKISINVLKYLKVNSEVLQTASDSVANIMKDVTKIDEIDKAMKESNENLKKLYIMEEKVYNETLPMLRKMLGFTDQVGNDMSKLNKNGLIITNWNVSNTIQNVQKIIKESFVGFNVTKEMDWALENLISTYSVISQMHKQILEYGETKSQAEYIAMMHLAKERKILAVDYHLTNALAKLETALIYNSVNDLYKEWIFAFKQFSFPNGGDILKLTEWPDSMAQDIDHVIDEIKTNVGNFNKLLIKESNFDNLLANRAPKLFRGSCSSDETSFFVWGKEGTGHEIDNILSGEETTIVANTPTRGINALKFKKVGILFTSKNSSVHERLFKIMKNVRVNLTHHGDSIYRFNNKTFEIKTNPTVLTFNYPSTVDEIMRLPSSIYEKISNGAYMLSPYATWTIKLTSDNPRVFESLNEFKGQVDLELIGEGQVFESNQCDKACEFTMKKYYKFAYDIYY